MKSTFNFHLFLPIGFVSLCCIGAGGFDLLWPANPAAPSAALFVMSMGTCLLIAAFFCAQPTRHIPEYSNVDYERAPQPVLDSLAVFEAQLQRSQREDTEHEAWLAYHEPTEALWLGKE